MISEHQVLLFSLSMYYSLLQLIAIRTAAIPAHDLVLPAEMSPNTKWCRIPGFIHTLNTRTIPENNRRNIGSQLFSADHHL